MRYRLCLVGVLALALLSPAAADARPGCPANTGTDLYVNPDPSIKRQKKLEATGLSSPAKCTFPSITDAIEAAEARELGSGARIILTGATAGEPALFTNEVFPLSVPSGVTITTSDDPDLTGGTGLDPANYVVRFGGSATHAVSLDGGGLKGITVENVRFAPATAMVICDGGTTAFDTVTLDGGSTAGGLIAKGLQLSSGCVVDAEGVRVRDFGGDGVVVDAGADLTLDASKVYGNGDDGLAISGVASISLSEVAFNGDDGAWLDAPASSDFFGNDVRDNGGNGLEVHAGDSSFRSNQIHNNSRSTGWDQPQVLFDGDGNPPPPSALKRSAYPSAAPPVSTSISAATPRPGARTG